MKQRSLLMLLPFALIVTGCSGNLKKGSILNEKFMKNNFGSDVVTKYEYLAPEKVELNFDDGVTAESVGAQRDLMIVKKDGKFGYYNILTNTYPLPLSLELTSVNYKNEGIFRILYGSKTVDEKEVMFIYDDYGNKLYEGEKFDPGVGVTTLKRYQIKENERYKCVITNNSVDTVFVYYNVDGSFKEVLTREEYYERDPYYLYGSSMAEYGHPELYKNEKLSSNENRVTVFNSKRAKFVSSFVIPQAKSYSFIIGDRYIYQIKDQLPDRAEKYDYSIGEDKYNIKTYSVNYLTGQVKEIKTDLIFTSGCVKKDLVNNKGYQEYTYLEKVYTIGKDKVRSNSTREIILDENLKEVADVSSTHFNTLRLFGSTDNYYVNAEGVIFDAKLKEVGLVRGDLSMGVGHVIREGVKYGLINHKGETIAEPIYKGLGSALEKNYFLLESEESWKFVKINEQGELEEIKEISKNDYSKLNYFGKYYEFRRLSDSKTIVVDITTGAESDKLTGPDGATDVFLNAQGTRVLSTLTANMCMSEKDGHFTVIRTVRKNATSFAFKK